MLGNDLPDLRHGLWFSGSDHQPDPIRRPIRDEQSHRHVERLTGSQLFFLDLSRPRVGRPRQDKHTGVVMFEEGLDRIGPQIRADGDCSGTKPIEGCGGVGLSR